MFANYRYKVKPVLAATAPIDYFSAPKFFFICYYFFSLRIVDFDLARQDYENLYADRKDVFFCSHSFPNFKLVILIGDGSFLI